MAVARVSIQNLDRSYWALRWTFGLVPIIAGLDKFFNLLVDWSHYLSPFALKLLPLTAKGFMGLVGVVEIAVGVLVLSSRSTRIGAFVASAWLVLVALNLIAGGFYDIAVRDLGLAVGAYVLGTMHAARLDLSVERYEPPRPTAPRPTGPIEEGPRPVP